jgi:hypothetical protein
MEESVVMMKNPVVGVRSLVFFNECSIIHAPLLTVLGWLFWRNVYIVDNSCYIRTVQHLGSHTVSYHLFSFCKSIQDYIIHMDMEIVILMFHLQKLQIVMDPLDDFVFFVLVVLEDSCFFSINILLFSGMWHHGMWPKFSHIFEGPFASIYPQDRGSRITWNVSKFLQDYTASYPRGQYSPFCPFFFDKFPANETLYPQKQSSYQTDGFPAAVRHRTTDSYSHLTQHTPAGFTVII